MKTIKLFFGILALSLMITVTACKGEKKEETTVDTEQMETKEYASAYVCPMHCEGSGSDAEGECPKCGMAYVKNEDHNADGHDH